MHTHCGEGCCLCIQKLVSKKGQPCLITSVYCLGLVLVFSQTMGKKMVLFTMFGLTPFSSSLWLRFSRSVLVYLLKHHTLVGILMPSDEKVSEYKRVITKTYGHLEHVYCVAGGFKIDLQACGNYVIQEIFYNR